MSQKSVPLYLELHPSRIFAAVLLVVHGGAAGCVLIVPLSWPVRVLLAALILLSLWYTLSRWGLLRHNRAVTALLWDDLGEWKLFSRDRKETAVRLEPDSFVSPGWVVLNFSAIDAPGRWSVVLLPDSLDGESFRRLRVRLRLEGREAPE